MLFTACLSTEVAFETNGQGEFTVRATRLLSERGPALTNDEFVNGVIDAFGAGRRQTPTMACAPALRGRQVFQAFATGPSRGVPGAARDLGGGMRGEGRLARAADALEAAARELRQE